jgi:hypothetical protein
MIAVIAASPGRALDPLIAACRDAGGTELWSPLAAPTWLARAPGPLGRFASRRVAGDLAAPPILVVDAVLRAWASDRTDRRYRAEFWLRTAIDAWAATEVRRRKPRVVIAPSLAARRTFAAARAIGATCILVLDVPLLRALHRDLDRAAAVWPDRRFLRRFRAPSWAIARQEAERVLADLVLVRGAYARSLCLADGIPEARLGSLPVSPAPAPEAPAIPTGRIRLAGLAAARHGIDTALAATRNLGLTLVVRTGEGTEPSDLAQHPGIAIDDGPVDAIICPAVCEAYAPELRSTTIPVIASPTASLDGLGPDPYDARAFATAIEAALCTPRAPSPIPSIAPLLAALS